MILNPEGQSILTSWSKEHQERAVAALSEGYAYCASCVSVGMSNCGYFDECGGAVFPDMILEKDLQTLDQGV